MLLVTTAVPAPLNDDDSDSFDTIIIIVEAAVAALLVIIITLLIITLLFHIIKRRKMSSVTVKHSSQSGVIGDDHNTAGTSQQSLSDKDTLSQGAKVDSTSSLEILNDLYSTKAKSLDLLLQHDNKSLPPSIVDSDVAITPNPSYAVPSETRPKSKHEYDYIIAHKPSHKEYLQLIGSTTSCNDAVTYPANDDDVINDLNPSHSLRQDSQDVTQEDFLPYVQMNVAK